MGTQAPRKTVRAVSLQDVTVGGATRGVGLGYSGHEGLSPGSVSGVFADHACQCQDQTD